MLSPLAPAPGRQCIRPNAQYGSMVLASLSVLGRLMRVQAVRQKREPIEGAASQGACSLHIAERPMVPVVDPGAEPTLAAMPGATPAVIWTRGLRRMSRAMTQILRVRLLRR